MREKERVRAKRGGKREELTRENDNDEGKKTER